MSSIKNKNVLNEIIDSQSNFVDQIVENTKKLTKNMPIVNETIDKGHVLLKEGIRKQKDAVTDFTGKIEKTQSEMNTSKEEAQNFFNSWFENQTNWAKSLMNNITSNNSETTDWMKQWNSYMNPNNNFMNYMNNSMTQNPWMNMMNNANGFQMNPESMQKKMNEGMTQWTTQVKQYSDMMSSTYEEWMKQLNQTTSKDSFKGMINLHDHLGKFFDLWVPMLKSINDKSFNSTMMNDLMNTAKYKEFMDSFFKFMPDENQKMMNEMNQNFIQYMKTMTENSSNAFNSFKSQMNGLNMMNTNPYSNMMDMYTSWRNSMNEAVSPLTKLMNTTQFANKDSQVWNELADMMTQFQIKNSELQYMIYQQGVTVMNKLTDKVSNKLKNGESIDSIVQIYQDWLMLGDETFSTLFNSDAYSKLMTEVSSLQMKIKNQMDLQMENVFLVNLPVATRTEMNEIYKSIYDLKKMFHHMERFMNHSKENDAVEPEIKKGKK